MFDYKYYSFITNFCRIGEKFIHQNMNKNSLIDCLDIKQLEITFRIPSESKYEHGFIALLMLTEKILSHKPIFLLDKNTLSKKRAIKVGLVVTIKDEAIENYLELCNMHSIPKFYDYGISFTISNVDQPFAYKIKKILSNTIFSFDKDIHSYYDYLGELNYEFDFLFRTYFKNLLMNKLIMSNKGIYFSDFINLIKTNMIDEIEKRVELEELEELEELKLLGLTDSEDDSDFYEEDENNYIDNNEIIEDTSEDDNEITIVSEDENDNENNNENDNESDNEYINDSDNNSESEEENNFENIESDFEFNINMNNEINLEINNEFDIILEEDNVINIKELNELEFSDLNINNDNNDFIKNEFSKLKIQFNNKEEMDELIINSLVDTFKIKYINLCITNMNIKKNEILENGGKKKEYNNIINKKNNGR